MEGMPVRWFYRYRYLHFWEAEVPVGCDVHVVKTAIVFMNKSSRLFFSVATYTREDWEQQSAEVITAGERKTWDEVAKYHVFLPEDEAERKPLIDRENWNKELQQTWHGREWRFRDENFLIMIMQHSRVEKRDPAHDAIVDRFVNSLRVVEV